MDYWLDVVIGDIGVDDLNIQFHGVGMLKRYYRGWVVIDYEELGGLNIACAWIKLLRT